jgi:hypothetical protein
MVFVKILSLEQLLELDSHVHFVVGRSVLDQGTLLDLWICTIPRVVSLKWVLRRRTPSRTTSARNDSGLNGLHLITVATSLDFLLQILL